VLASRRDGAVGHPSAAPSNSQGEISVVDVHKAFGVTKALDGCTFSAKCGEIHAIVGGNGCGKSTLAKVLSGVLPADSGQVSVLGHTPLTPHHARSIGIATVFQEILVADECSVVDNLFVGSDGLWTKSMPTRAKISTAESLMKDLTGTDIDPHMLVRDLPLSVKQWITIGRALLCESKILILDESSAALDLDSTEKLFGKMRELRDRGAAVIIVTHRIAELIRISDRATVMRDGRNVGVLEKGQITEENLLALMTGKSEKSAITEEAAHEALSDEVVLDARGIRIWPEGELVEFDLFRGEIVGVAGLDGHGQDEFVRALAGVQPALQGLPTARNDAGEVVEITNLEDAEDCHVAYVSGDRKREGIIPNLSIFENVLIPLYHKHLRLSRLGVIDWAALSGVFDWSIERLSIKVGEKSNMITSLSGGNQQKVLVGRSLALQPNILILNDPARGIDVQAKSELYKHLKDYASHGHSVVFMSSELEEFIGLCSRVIVFRHGSIFDTISANEVQPARILEAMFGQTNGQGVRSKQDLTRKDRLRSKVVSLDGEKDRLQAKIRVGRVKVVDFDRENHQGEDDSESRGSARPIKIVYSDV
jgi:ribose transport system ATP-binding protein